MNLKNYVTAAELARKWGVAPQRVSWLIRNGRIKGTKMVFGRRLVPKKTKQPKNLPPGRKPQE